MQADLAMDEKSGTNPHGSIVENLPEFHSPSSYKECFSCKPIQILVWSSFVTQILSSILVILELWGFVTCPSQED